MEHRGGRSGGGGGHAIHTSWHGRIRARAHAYAPCMRMHACMHEKKAERKERKKRRAETSRRLRTCFLVRLAHLPWHQREQRSHCTHTPRNAGLGSESSPRCEQKHGSDSSSPSSSSSMSEAWPSAGRLGTSPSLTPPSATPSDTLPCMLPGPRLLQHPEWHPALAAPFFTCIVDVRRGSTAGAAGAEPKEPKHDGRHGAASCPPAPHPVGACPCGWWSLWLPVGRLEGLHARPRFPWRSSSGPSSSSGRLASASCSPTSSPSLPSSPGRVRFAIRPPPRQASSPSSLAEALVRPASLSRRRHQHVEQSAVGHTPVASSAWGHPPADASSLVCLHKLRMPAAAPVASSSSARVGELLSTPARGAAATALPFWA